VSTSAGPATVAARRALVVARLVNANGIMQVITSTMPHSSAIQCRAGNAPFRCGQSRAGRVCRWH
jgi:hypothetical protein